MNKEELYLEALKIRGFEQLLLDTYDTGEISGTIHTCIGQEVNSLVVIEKLKKEDTVFSNHRGHGHYLAKTGNYEKLLCELLGLDSGVNSGIGGSQHLHEKGFYTNGIQGGSLPLAAGYAFSNQLNDKDSICVSFIGDGTLGEGIVYETLNLLGLIDSPLLIIVENNKYAQSSKIEDTFSGVPFERLSSFGLKCMEVDPLELDDMANKIKNSINEVRSLKKAQVIIINSSRIGPHSKGDDYRSKSEVEEAKALDPLKKIKPQLTNSSSLEKEAKSFIENLKKRILK
jgi:2-oxoisovalerate dehydrogenase E1 component